MSKERYILVGAKPHGKTQHYGGVLTLSRSLTFYAEREGHEVEVVNTLRSSIDEVPIIKLFLAGGARVYGLLKALHVGDCSGVIIFSGAGYSFYERVLLSALCRLYKVNALLVIVDGWFFEIQQAFFLKRLLYGALLRLPCKLFASGNKWVDLFKDLKITQERIVHSHYWLPDSFSISMEPKVVKPGKKLQFVFVGWMIKEKGLEEIMAAIGELRKNYEFYFIFVGDGPLLGEVRKQIGNFGWQDSVSAPGWVSNEEFQQLLSLSDVFVLPSYAEGFPMSLIEAFSKGLPAIATDVGGISDSLRDGVNGYLIPPRQVSPLIEAMKCYLRKPQIINEHSRAALEMVRVNHDAKNNCEDIFKALK